jgi:branched-chain amino acid transport system permease protein
MKDLVVFTLLGLGSGTLAAGLAMGVVLSYRGSGVINLAAGAIATLGAYVFYGLRQTGDLFLPPIPFAGAKLDLGGAWGAVPALLVALAVCGLTGALLDVCVLRRLRGSSPLAKLVATLGLLLTLNAIVVLRFGGDAHQAPAILPAKQSADVFGSAIPLDRFWLLGIVLLVTALLAWTYRRTRFGLATRAAQENEAVATFFGLSPDALSLANTVLGSVLAGALGALAAPTAQLDPSVLTFAIIPALAAALLARFTSFTIAALAGLAMGVIEALVTWLESYAWFPTAKGLPIPGVPALIFFLIIVAVMFWRGDALPQRGAAVERRLPAAPAATRVLAPALALSAACAVALVAFPFDYRQALITSLIGVLMCLSLVVLTGFVGQISLMQVALAGATALVMSKVANGWGLGFPLAPLIGVAAALAVGLATAASALRVRGVNLAIVTMAAALALQSFWFENTQWGIDPLGSKIPFPHLLGLDLGTAAGFPLGDGATPSPVFGFLCLAVVLAAGLSVVALRRGEWGRRMLAVRSNERAAASAGIDVARTKLLAYAISSTIAGCGGALYAYDFGTVTSSRFTVAIALAFVAFAYVGGITTVSGAIVGGLLATEGLVVYASDKLLGVAPEYEVIVAGLLLMWMVAQFPEGVAGWAARVRRGGMRLGAPRWGRRRAAGVRA